MQPLLFLRTAPVTLITPATQLTQYTKLQLHLPLQSVPMHSIMCKPIHLTPLHLVACVPNY
jgi:hypothetical protein